MSKMLSKLLDLDGKQLDVITMKEAGKVNYYVRIHNKKMNPERIKEADIDFTKNPAVTKHLIFA